MRLKRGFTLIECLIVLVIISIVSTAAVLSLHFNQKKRLELVANQFMNLMTIAQEEALLKSDILGVSFKNNQWRFERFEETTQKWVPLTNKIWHQQVDNRIALTLTLPEEEEEENKENHPAIIISPSGDITPFTLSISFNGDSKALEVRASESGNFTRATLE